MKYDYLIIGQGLAGSVLAYQLLKRDKRIAIIDENAVSTSSKVAAGLVNPFTGPKMVKSWKAEILFPYLVDFYRNVEIETSGDFFSERMLYRPFASVEELNDWYGRSSQPNYQKFIHKMCNPGEHGDFVYDKHGGVEITSYVLNMPVFLEAMKSFLGQRSEYVIDRFDEDQLKVQPGDVHYKDLKANAVIFCNGYQVKDSKYFGWVPIAPVKGEILHVEFEKDFQTIYNRSCFIIPQGGRRFKAGSTYNRHDMTETITESGKYEICEKLGALSPMSYKITGHEAGIRPGSVTRRPLIGAHPEFKNMFLFNGLGTKGVSLAPFFSDQLAKCLEEGNNLDEEVDIKKYYSLYFNSQFQEES